MHPSLPEWASQTSCLPLPRATARFGFAKEQKDSPNSFFALNMAQTQKVTEATDAGSENPPAAVLFSLYPPWRKGHVFCGLACELARCLGAFVKENKRETDMLSLCVFLCLAFLLFFFFWGGATIPNSRHSINSHNLTDAKEHQAKVQWGGAKLLCRFDLVTRPFGLLRTINSLVGLFDKI